MNCDASLNNSWFYGAEHDKKRTTIEIESDLGFDLGLFSLVVLTLSCKCKALFPWQKGREKDSNCTKRNLKQISAMPLQPLSNTTVRGFYFIL
jgi:hypothetical protein